ncbi:SGNH/GDSL hydrolase family protein [Sphingobium yanoikuyae]|uniref:SGNH/GDSL hydrolase family protein n=1 Tax=Sphingobium yanoikuyae TaxID=13690 RepID=UPI0035C6E42D
MALSDVKVIKVTTALADPLAAKADSAAVNASLTALQGNLNEIEAESVSRDDALGTRIDGVEDELAGKADAGAVNSGLLALQGNLNEVESESVARDDVLTAAVATKASAADLAALETEVATKANAGDVNTGLNTLQTEINAIEGESIARDNDLGARVDAAETEIATKANAGDVNTGLNTLQTNLNGETNARAAADAAESATRLGADNRGFDYVGAIIASVRAFVIRMVGNAESRLEGRADLRAIAARDLMRKRTGAVQSLSIDMTGSMRSVRREGMPAAALEIEDVIWSVTGNVVSVQAGRTALRSAGRAIYPIGSVSIDPIASATVVGEEASIVYVANTAAASFALAGAGGRLDHARLSNVVVRDAATDAVLVLGTDYLLNAEQGAIQRAAAGSALAVEVDYDYSEVRYDLIETDINGALSVKKGTARNRDVAEYLPARSAGKYPLLIVRVTAAGMTIWRWQDQERSQVQAPAIIQRGRAKALGNFHRALRDGATVRIAGYGTSRTNLGGVAASLYAANGQQRDRMADSGFMAAQDAAFIATLPLFDHGDGAGQVHTRIGWNWTLKAAIEQRYPNIVEYLNFGIGGTTSGNTDNGGTVPARLAGLTGSGAHLAVIEFGMNELGAAGADTITNLIAIGEACRAANIDPVFIAPARPNATYSADILDRWVVENRQIAAAADYLSAPFIDTASVFGVDRLGPLDPRDMCGSNLFNHDSVFELGLVGRALTSIVLG